jgi:hypothetical protein
MSKNRTAGLTPEADPAQKNTFLSKEEVRTRAGMRGPTAENE